MTSIKFENAKNKPQIISTGQRPVYWVVTKRSGGPEFGWYEYRLTRKVNAKTQFTWEVEIIGTSCRSNSLHPFSHAARRVTGARHEILFAGKTQEAWIESRQDCHRARRPWRGFRTRSRGFMPVRKLKRMDNKTCDSLKALAVGKFEKHLRLWGIRSGRRVELTVARRCTR